MREIDWTIERQDDGWWEASAYIAPDHRLVGCGKSRDTAVRQLADQLGWRGFALALERLAA